MRTVLVWFLFLSPMVLWGQGSSDPNLGAQPSQEMESQNSDMAEDAPETSVGVPIGQPSTGADDAPSASESESDTPPSEKSKASSEEPATAEDEVDTNDSSASDTEANMEATDESASSAADEPMGGTGGDSEEEVDENIVTADPEVLKELPPWNCRVDTPPQSEGSFTVGEKFVLICSGETVDFGQGKIHFQMPEPLLYAIQILTVDRVKPNELLFTATSYAAGQHDLKGLVIVEDLQEKLTVTPLMLNVRSVIKDPKQKSFGPQRALGLEYPPWLWIGMLVFVVFILSFGLFRLHRRAQRLRVLEGLKLHNSALGAYNQLNKDLRQLNRNYVFSKHREWTPEKTNTYMSELDSFFRLYLLREFIVPATEWKSSLVIKEIHKNDRKGFSTYGPILTKYLKELDRAQSAIEKLGMEDCQQLTQLARRVSQKIWQSRKASGGAS